MVPRVNGVKRRATNPSVAAELGDAISDVLATTLDPDRAPIFASVAIERGISIEQLIAAVVAQMISERFYLEPIQEVRHAQGRTRVPKGEHYDA